MGKTIFILLYCFKMDDADYVFVTFGASGVGKTSLLERYVHNNFVEEHHETIDDLLVKRDEIGEEYKVINFYDHGGDGNLFTDNIFDEASGFICVYDVGSRESFE